MVEARHRFKGGMNAGGRLMVSRAGGVFDETGNLADGALRAQLRKFPGGFTEYVRSRQ